MSTEAEKIKTAEELPPPIGEFILRNAEGEMGNDGMYYHYSTVCVLLKSYHQHRLSQILSELSDEKIERLIAEDSPDGEGWNELDRLLMEKGAKIIREFIKGKQ